MSCSAASSHSASPAGLAPSCPCAAASSGSRAATRASSASQAACDAYTASVSQVYWAGISLRGSTDCAIDQLLFSADGSRQPAAHLQHSFGNPALQHGARGLGSKGAMADLILALARQFSQRGILIQQVEQRIVAEAIR